MQHEINNKNGRTEPSQVCDIDELYPHLESESHTTGREWLTEILSHRVEMTLFNSKSELGKRYTFEENKLVKSSAANMYDGSAERVHCLGLVGIRNLISEVGSYQAIALGSLKPFGREFQITTKAKAGASKISRSKDSFHFVSGSPCVVLLDFDCLADAISAEEAINQVMGFPGLEQVAFVVRPSGGSCIVNAGDILRGVTGVHAFVVLSDGADIQGFKSWLLDQCWLAGSGRYDVSASGALLERVSIDMAVFDPERLVFEASAVCTPPLLSKRPDAVIVEGMGCGRTQQRIDFAALPPITQADRQSIDLAKAAARAEKLADAEAKRSEYCARQGRDVAVRTGISAEVASNQFMEMLSHSGPLPGGMFLHMQDGTKLTVNDLSAKIQSDPKAFHKARLLDPIDPERRGGSDFCAVIHTDRGSEIVIHSFAHGKSSYRFSLNKPTHVLRAGQEIETLNIIAGLLRDSGRAYVRGSVLCQLRDCSLVPFNPRDARLKIFLSGLADWKASDKVGSLRSLNFPQGLATDFIENGDFSGIQVIKSLANHPVVVPGGRLIQAEGVDAATGVLLALRSGEWSDIDTKPSDDQVRAAASRLLVLIEEFPFVSAEDRSVALACMLTAAIRPGMHSSPVFIYDAPAAGTGKTFLAQICGAIAQGMVPAALNGEDFCDGAEGRKALNVLMQTPRQVWLFDNIPVGQAFGRGSLDALITAGSAGVVGRGFGTGGEVRGSLDGLLMATGNGVAIGGDLARRSLLCRLDASCERPEQRKFKSNPLDFVVKNHRQVVEDCLTVILGSFATKRLVGGAPLAGFEEWDALVRQPIVAMQLLGLDVCDPVKAQESGRDRDVAQNALSSMLETLWIAQCAKGGLGDRWTVGNVATGCKDATERESALRRNDPHELESHREMNGHWLNLNEAWQGWIGSDSTKSLGRQLSSAEGRQLGGLRLVKRVRGKHASLWSVESVG